jgi:hypothetical protein
VTGVSPASVFAISLDRDSAGSKGVMYFRLSGEGTAAVKGSVTLGEVERRELLAGRLALVVYTKGQPHGALRAVLKPKG